MGKVTETNSHNVAMSTKAGLKTLVLLCGHLGGPAQGLDLEGLGCSLEARLVEVEVEASADLCRHLGRLSQVVAARRADRAVLGLCSGDYSQIELQSGARKAGLDPFGVEVVPLGTLCARIHPSPQATWKAEALLAAAVARAQAFPGSRPEHAKPYFLPRGERVSRRHLFTIPPLGYRPLPSIRAEQCAAEGGCELCARACPRQAMRRTKGRLLLNRSLCEGCGVCLAACPKEAIEFPGWSLPQFEAQLAALLDSALSASEPLGILLTCQKALSKLEALGLGGASYSHQWLPVAVPCLGMVTPGWLLQALAGGASAVALLFCGPHCPYGQGQTIGGRVSFCRRLLERLGQEPDRVRILSASQPEKLLAGLRQPPVQSGGLSQEGRRQALRLGRLLETSMALQRLARQGNGVSRAVLEHPYSPFGLVELRAQGCTTCLSCVQACPTGALLSEQDAAVLRLTFTASSCTGCGICVDSCPEVASQALQVRRMTNLPALAGGRVVIGEDEVVRCKRCGGIIASRALLRQVVSQQAGASEALKAALTEYCSSCRWSLA